VIFSSILDVFVWASKTSVMAFQKLFELIEDNRFENDTDKKIAEKIFEVERD